MGPGFESQRDHKKTSTKVEVFFVPDGFEQKGWDGFDPEETQGFSVTTTLVGNFLALPARTTQKLLPCKRMPIYLATP